MCQLSRMMTKSKTPQAAKKPKPQISSLLSASSLLDISNETNGAALTTLANRKAPPTTHGNPLLYKQMHSLEFEVIGLKTIINNQNKIIQGLLNQDDALTAKPRLDNKRQIEVMTRKSCELNGCD